MKGMIKEVRNKRNGEVKRSRGRQRSCRRKMDTQKRLQKDRWE